MVKINVESLSEGELRKRFSELSRKGDWDKECEACKNPVLLHKTNCTRKVEVGEAEFSELWKIWSAFKAKMEPIRKWHGDEMEKRQQNSELLLGLQNMTEAITKGNKEMCNVFKDRPNKLVKPIEKQKVQEIVELLKLKHGRTRIEELEELTEDWIKFNFNEHEI